MSFNKKFFTTGGIVASAPPAAAGLDPLQNFETVTYTGNGSTQKITGYIRKGAAFNGSSSKIQLPSNVSVATGNNDFTLSTWVYLYTMPSTFASVITTQNNYYFYILISSDGSIRTYNQNVQVNSAAGVITTGQWYNIVATLDSTNGKNVYVNGTNVATSSNTSNCNSSTGGHNAVGYYSNNGSTFQYYLDGKIDQVRIFNRALLEDNNGVNEIQALADETYADPKKSTTDYFGDGSGVALYELDEDANSSNFEQAAVFNGSSSNIQINQFSGFTNYNFTLSIWIKTTDTSAYITSFRDPMYITFGTGLYAGGTNGMGIYDGTNQYFINNTAMQGINDGNWHHIVMTHDGTNLKGYIDKTPIATVPTGTTTQFSGGTNHNRIGVRADGNTAAAYNGSIDQVRIYDTALDITDIEKLYKESADVPTANLVAHYKLDGDATDETETYDGAETSITYSAGVYGGTPTNVNFLGMAFQPDFVWIKLRDASAYNSGLEHHVLVDSVRGANKLIQSNLTNFEGTFTNQLNSFDSNGFTIEGFPSSDPEYGRLVNEVNKRYVAWCWKAGGAAVSNTEGDITSTVSANQDAGFSIVKWTANGGDATIGHGISTPELIIAKRTDSTSNWAVQVPSIGNGYLLLNSTSGYLGADPSIWNNTSPTSEVFSTAGSSGEFFNTGNFIAYCFHSVDGYQKVGSYTGTGGNQTISVGFQPRFVMIKRATGGSLNGWVMSDYQRGAGINLFANSGVIEANESAYGPTSFTSDGFTLAQAGGNTNVSGSTYIYLAIA